MQRPPLDPPFSFTALIKLAIAVTVVFLASLLGQIATMKSLADWYVGLVKPGFTPPNIAFPIVWTLLYALMAWSLWRLLRLPAATAGRERALMIFAGQLALNTLWSWAFFGARNPLAGLAVILALIIAIAMTIRAFAALDRPAAYALVPYGLWVSYAAVLNAAIVWLNR